jgi:hypothetical protein
MKNPTLQLRDSAATRWLMLLLVAITMFAAYVASDVFSPLQTMLERYNQWNPSEYGWFSGSYTIFNVFLGMLIFGGLILDKKGIRFSGIMSSILMVVGISIKYWAVSNPALLENTMTFLGDQYKMQVVWAVTLIGGLFITVLSFILIMTVYGRFFKLYLYTAIAPIPLSTFAGEPTQQVGKSFLKSFCSVCLEGAIIVLACIIFSVFASSPPVVDTNAAAVTQVWKYIGELIFNMLVLVGTVKMSDRVVREMMGL